jgi:putative oxidoreductase
VRRLFSTFAQGWPGAGLLILRLVAASAAVACGLHGLQAAQSESAVVAIAAIIAGALLSMGLWTPVSGCVVAGFALWALMSKSGDPWTNILLAGVGVALSMIGPGAWSLDARLFGWRRTLIQDREGIL